MVGYVGRVDEIRLVSEVRSDLREQILWETVEGRVQGIDVTTQQCERRPYVLLEGFHLTMRVRMGRDGFESEDMTDDELLKGMEHGWL